MHTPTNLNTIAWKNAALGSFQLLVRNEKKKTKVKIILKKINRVLNVF